MGIAVAAFVLVNLHVAGNGAPLECRDGIPDCKTDAAAGNCYHNDSMLLNCPASCNSCHMSGPDGLRPLDAHGRPVPCIDMDGSCPEWASRGECANNPGWMLFNCAVSCRSCWRLDYKLNECRDGASDCHTRAAAGRCNRNDALLLECPVSCGSCHMIGHSRVVGEPELVPIDRYHKPVMCADSSEKCSGWARRGECDNNPTWMLYNCPKACRSCWRLDYKSTCAASWKGPMAIQPGSIDALFGRYAEAAQLPKAVRLAECAAAGAANETCAAKAASYVDSQAEAPTKLSREELQSFKPSVLSAAPEGPWIVQFDNFLTEGECNYLIEWMSTVNRFQTSSEASGVMSGRFDQTTSEERRSSSSAWCQDWKCMADPVVRTVSERIARLTGVPVSNSEHLQLLRYLPTQRYVEHHDYLEASMDFSPGPRIMTLFVYLSSVEAGGETHFMDTLHQDGIFQDGIFQTSNESTRRSLKVKPKAGRAVLWPNVMNHDVVERDMRTRHEAIPVEQGVKYAINAWLHLRDYREAFNVGCAGQ